MDAVSAVLAAAKEKGQEGEDTPVTAAALAALADQVDEARTRLAAVGVAEAANLRRLRDRLEHLGPDGAGPPSRGEAMAWTGRRLDLLLADHCWRRGYLESAAGLEAASSRPADDDSSAPGARSTAGAPDQHRDLTDGPLFREAHAVAAALDRGDVSSALRWCAAHRARLRKLHHGRGSRLELRLRAQELIELGRGGDAAAALAHARRHLAPHAHVATAAAAAHDAAVAAGVAPSAPRRPALPAELRRAAGALVLGPRTGLGRHAGLYRSVTAWPALRRQFLADFWALHGLPSASLLGVHLEAGLCALRLPPMQAPDGAQDDPLASEPFRSLALPLPWCKQVHSRLICPLDGSPMDEDNPPLLLPSGRVVGQRAAQLAAARPLPGGGPVGRVPCPETGVRFPLQQARRLFIT